MSNNKAQEEGERLMGRNNWKPLLTKESFGMCRVIGKVSERAQKRCWEPTSKGHTSL
jgi:hypothetical protein